MAEKPSKQLLDFIDNAANKEDVAQLFQKLHEFLQGVKTSLENSALADRENVQAALQSLSQDLLGAKNELLERQNGDKATMYSESRTLMRRIDQAIDDLRAELPDLTPFATKDDVANVEAKIPAIPPQFDPTDITTRLSDIEEALEKLRDEFTRLPRNSGTATAVSDLRIIGAFKRILKTEEPVGDIDGVNTTYRVSQPIFAVLSFSLNGETIAQLPNYSIKGNQIIFASALPADYDGSDFEVKYI